MARKTKAKSVSMASSWWKERSKILASLKESKPARSKTKQKRVKANKAVKAKMKMKMKTKKSPKAKKVKKTKRA